MLNTILSILLLITLAIAIVCDIIRIFQFRRTIEESKQNVKETMSKIINKSYYDWMNGDDGIVNGTNFGEYFKNNFDKYL